MKAKTEVIWGGGEISCRRNAWSDFRFLNSWKWLYFGINCTQLQWTRRIVICDIDLLLEHSCEWHNLDYCTFICLLNKWSFQKRSWVRNHISVLVPMSDRQGKRRHLKTIQFNEIVDLLVCRLSRKSSDCSLLPKICCTELCCLADNYDECRSAQWGTQEVSSEQTLQNETISFVSSLDWCHRNSSSRDPFVII